METDYESTIYLFKIKVGIGSFLQCLCVNLWIYADFIVVLIFFPRWTKNHKGSSFPLVVLKERTIRVPALTRGQWHHLVISFTQPKLSAEEQKNMDEEKLPSSKVRHEYG